jgi:uncharacterized protein (DUF2345 family)
MKTFTVIQTGGNTVEIEADEAEYHAGGAFLVKDGQLVFAGPPGFTTLIENGAVKNRE